MLDKLYSRLGVIDQQLADSTLGEYKRNQLTELRRSTVQEIQAAGGSVSKTSTNANDALHAKIDEIEQRVDAIGARLDAIERRLSVDAEETLSDVLG